MSAAPAPGGSLLGRPGKPFPREEEAREPVGARPAGRRASAAEPPAGCTAAVLEQEGRLEVV